MMDSSRFCRSRRRLSPMSVSEISSSILISKRSEISFKVSKLGYPFPVSHFDTAVRDTVTFFASSSWVRLCVSRSLLILSLNIELLSPCIFSCGFSVLYSKAWKKSRHFRSHRCDSGGIDSNLANIQYFAGLYAVLCNEIGRRKATAKEMLPGVF